MTYPALPLTVHVPFFFYGMGGTPVTSSVAIGELTLEPVSTFEWGQAEPTPVWRLVTTVTTPPNPPGGPWFGGITTFSNAERYRTNLTPGWLPANGAISSQPIWQGGIGGQVIGLTGAFRIKYPSGWSVGAGFTFSGSAEWNYIWPSDVLPPGVDEANPVRFTAKPMASAKGALQTVIDGGGP